MAIFQHDTDRILNNRLQLGQFIYLKRLEFATPIPRSARIRPVAGHHAFVGTLEPLIARIFNGSKRDFVIQPVFDSEYSLDPIAVYLNNRRLEDDKGDVTKPNARQALALVNQNKENRNQNRNQRPKQMTPQRFSSPVFSKRSVSSGENNSTSAVTVEKDPSPAISRKGRRYASPVPSKCVVPSLAAAREDNIKVGREPAIVVPSRYRQPSPNGRKINPSPSGRRMSFSPGRKLSSGLKMSPMVGDSSGKKKMAAIASGISKCSEALAGSFAKNSNRKSWDEPLAANGNFQRKQKEKGSVKNKPDHRAILRTQDAMSRWLSDANRRKCNSSTCEEKAKSCSSEGSLLEEVSAFERLGIAYHERKWTDGSVALDSISEELAKLGKEAMQRRDFAASAAARALEEAKTLTSSQTKF